MPTDPPESPPPSPADSDVEIARSASRQRNRLASAFDADLLAVAHQFMRRRRSLTLDATDIDAAHAWLTRPARKAAARDAIASVAIFIAAGLMAYGINKLSATPPDRGGWFVVVASIIFGAFAEVFRRWEYD